MGVTISRSGGTMASVGIREVRKSFGSTEILHGVSIDIVDGEFVTLVGPSGCGKSTLLRMIAGLEGITGGQISIGDRVVNNVAPKERDIAMVFQNYALYPHMTVAENMAFSLMLKARQRRRPRPASAGPPRSSAWCRCSSDTRASSPAASGSASPCAPRSRNCTSA